MRLSLSTTFVAKRKRFSIVCMLTLGFFQCGTALSAEVDWKLYGGLEGMRCFYDETGVKQLPGHLVRVWTKCLRETELETFDVTKAANKAVLERSAERVAHYYVPPLAMIEDATPDQALTVTMYEAMASLARLEPQVSIYYELNCQDQMVRELSLLVKVKGQSRTSERPTVWRYVPPEGNAARLIQMLCRAGRAG